METLNQIAETIAYKLGDQFNSTLKESIKDDAIGYRAKFLRDDEDRNSISVVHTSQTLIIPFERISLLEAFGVNMECITAICPNTELQEKYMVLRSKKEIPLPIRFKNTSRNPYMYVGRQDGSKSFTYTSIDKFPYYINLPYNSKTVYYTIINKRVYIINNLNECDLNSTLNLCGVLMQGVFENPRDFYNACDSDDFADDLRFPIGLDMLAQIKKTIISEYPIKPKDAQQVNIKPDDND
jgi:hypothetical protein